MVTQGVHPVSSETPSGSGPKSCPGHWRGMRDKMVQDSGKYLGMNLKSEGDKQIQGPRTAHPLPGIKDAHVTDSTTLRDAEKR